MNLQNLFLTFCLLLGLGINLNAQTRGCGTMEHLEHQQQLNPNIALKIQEIERHTNAFLSQAQRVEDIVTIPVVVHVLWNTTEENISDAQVLSQITVLTEDFRRMNADAVNTPADFQGVAADIELEFCLATVDPSGNPTTGITRTQTMLTEFSDDENQSAKFDAFGGKDAWPTDQYLNLWVCNLAGTLLGYAQFPGAGPANTDGVVLKYTAFGNTGTAEPPFELGRTATHEVGHWLNLHHIWGDGDCSVDDLVADTPVAGNSNGTETPCTYPGPNSCDEGPGDLPDMFQNYMDYSTDLCLNLFTLGQKARMRALFNEGGFRASLRNSNGCTPLPTCTDGIQNGNESGVDCGGNCPPCPIPGCTDPMAHNFNPLATVDNGSCVTCTDGIQNSDETGIDCGGSLCLPCVVEIPGCTNPNAHNYNASATTDDGSCETCTDGIQNGDETDVDCGGVLCGPCPVPGCTDQGAHNYNPLATVDDGSCETCNDGIQNGDETGIDCGGALCVSCGVPGCTDPNAYNYDPEAEVNDGSCENCSDGIQNGDETGVDCGGAFCTSDCSLPAGWAATGINCIENGEAHYTPATGIFDLSVENCYNPVFYSNNDFQEFVHQGLCGNGEIIAHVKSVSGNGWAGITMRESSNPGARMIQLAVNNSGLAQKKLRLSTGGIAFTSMFQNQSKYWLRLTRTGSQFRAYLSLDGLNWSIVLQTNLQMGSCIEVGLFLSNGAANSTASAQFDNVQIIGGQAIPTLQIPGANPQVEIYEPDFIVFPNPTRGELNIQLDAFMDQPLQLQVYNQQGQSVLTRAYGENHAPIEALQLQHLENGLYLIQIKTDQHIKTKKVNVIR